MSTYSLTDTVRSVTGQNHVTLTNTTGDIPVSLKIVLQQNIVEDFEMRIQSSGVENLHVLGRLIQGIGTKLIADAAAGKYQEED